MYDAHDSYMIANYDIVGKYIKASNIEQTKCKDDSNRFCVPYNDDG